MLPKLIRIATRQSPLALWQANHIRKALLSHWPNLQIELLPLKTSGDQFLKDKLIKIGGKGLFVKELEDALLAHRADLAVHSMKDVPASFPQGLALKAICTRHNPFDAFVSERYPDFSALPVGAIIGTSSLRRQSQLLAERRDLVVKTLRGNIHTRLQKMTSGEYDGIILAAAGLERMNMADQIKSVFSDSVMLPACGQGALGIECREDDPHLHAIIQPLNDPASERCVTAERRVNAILGGNCHAPIAIFCQIMPNQQLLLRAKIARHDGSKIITNQQVGPQENAMQLAEHCAKALLAEGADQLLSEVDRI